MGKKCCVPGCPPHPLPCLRACPVPLMWRCFVRAVLVTTAAMWRKEVYPSSSEGLVKRVKELRSNVAFLCSSASAGELPGFNQVVH
ncbi:Hypothetical protein FKW44_025129 [Caligus rogercresseyi]|uniref:Uncharacterized protein n=1 Tax=Caligus rogercresseyi TaxID=217165 RepID=A0A7T8JSF6_CALRO|nr:Hypothetical protein FKW44_025129 [Caligus rogercresseyi]